MLRILNYVDLKAEEEETLLGLFHFSTRQP